MCQNNTLTSSLTELGVDPTGMQTLVRGTEEAAVIGGSATLTEVDWTSAKTAVLQDLNSVPDSETKTTATAMVNVLCDEGPEVYDEALQSASQDTSASKKPSTSYDVLKSCKKRMTLFTKKKGEGEIRKLVRELGGNLQSVPVLVKDVEVRDLVNAYELIATMYPKKNGGTLQNMREVAKRQTNFKDYLLACATPRSQSDLMELFKDYHANERALKRDECWCDPRDTLGDLQSTSHIDITADPLPNFLREYMFFVWIDKTCKARMLKNKRRTLRTCEHCLEILPEEQNNKAVAESFKTIIDEKQVVEYNNTGLTEPTISSGRFEILSVTEDGETIEASTSTEFESEGYTISMLITPSSETTGRRRRLSTHDDAASDLFDAVFNDTDAIVEAFYTASQDIGLITNASEMRDLVETALGINYTSLVFSSNTTSEEDDGDSCETPETGVNDYESDVGYASIDYVALVMLVILASIVAYHIRVRQNLKTLRTRIETLATSLERRRNDDDDDATKTNDDATSSPKTTGRIDPLSFRNLSLVKGKDGTFVIHPCSGRFESGTLCALMGPSGSGKKSMLQLLAGKVSWDGAKATGTISLSGQTASDSAAAIHDNAHVPYCPQSPKRIHHTALTVGENMYVAAMTRFVDRSDAYVDERIAKALKQVELDDKVRTIATDLSFGEA
eukprot:g1255.t1